MYTDVLTRVDDARTMVGLGAGNHRSTSSIDTNADSRTSVGNQPRDMGSGMTIKMVVSVISAVYGGGPPSIKMQIASSTHADFSTGVVVLATTNVFALTSVSATELPTGAVFTLDVSQDLDDRGGMIRRYLGAWYTVADETIDAGTITTDFVIGVSNSRRYYASGFTVA